MAAGVPARLTAAQGRRFGLTVGGAFIVLGLLTGWRGHPTVAAVLAALGAALVLAALVAPTRLGPVERAWMALAHAMSRVTTPIVMGVVYFLVLTPAGLLRRTVGRSPIVPDRAAAGFWVRRDPAAPRGSMEHQF